MSDVGNSGQAEFWDEIASSWAAAEGHSELIAGGFGRAAMERLGMRPGDRVLDVGCGTGGTSLELAELVGPRGAVVGVDIAPAMIDLARSRAEGRSGTELDFRVADVEVDGLDGASFDGVFSRFGVMFFADPVAAFRNMRAMLRPGGRLAFACWQDLFSNEFMFVPGAAVIGVTGEFPPMPGAGEPGPFSLADVDRVQAILTDAGYSDVQVSPTSMVLALPEDRLDSIVELSSSVGPVHEALRDADEELTGRVLEAVREALRGKVIDGDLRLAAAAYIVSATA